MDDFLLLTYVQCFLHAYAMISCNLTCDHAFQIPSKIRKFNFFYATVGKIYSVIVMFAVGNGKHHNNQNLLFFKILFNHIRNCVADIVFNVSVY